MSNSIWLVGLFPFLFHLHYQIFQYLCINHGSWFIKERNGMEIHAKLQFINGSNFVKIAKRRTKMTHVIPKWLDVSLFWQIQSVRILSNYQNECISGHMTNPPSNGFCQISLTAPYFCSHKLVWMHFRAFRIFICVIKSLWSTCDVDLLLYRKWIKMILLLKGCHWGIPFKILYENGSKYWILAEKMNSPFQA